MMDFGPVISAYTAEQAVEDGMLVEVERRLSRRWSNDIYGNDLCFSAPVYVTTNLWHGHVVCDDDDLTEANVKRLLRAAFQAFKDGDTADLMRTNINAFGLTIWGVIDGSGLTLMLPEDY